MAGPSGKPNPSAAPGLRLDKWLWQARFFKNRGLAAEMIESLATQKLFGEFRGEAAVDRECLVDVLVHLPLVVECEVGQEGGLVELLLRPTDQVRELHAERSGDRFRLVESHSPRRRRIPPGPGPRR